MIPEHIKPFLLASLILTLVPSGVYAATDNRSAVRDTGGQIVRSSDANCVRTRWTSDHDPCAAKLTKQTELVVQETSRVKHKSVARKTSELTQDEKTVFFIFNHSSLTPEAKDRLNTLASVLKADTSVKEAKIVGFADRIGSDAYNEQLSQKRAESVRDYLIANGYTNARVTETRWVGEQEPSTNCAQDKTRLKLIECLQNDRRVEVEMVYLNERQRDQAQ